MTDRPYTDPYDDPAARAGRFGRWLSRRPAESWMFFAVGLVLGGFFF
mgnify:CR=1